VRPPRWRSVPVTPSGSAWKLTNPTPRSTCTPPAARCSFKIASVSAWETKQQEGIGGVGQPEPEQPHPDRAASGVELHPDRIVAVCQQLLGHPQPPQDLQRARLDRQLTRLVHSVGLPVDDPYRRAERLELGGQGEAGRSGADDHNVEPAVGWGHHVRVARLASRLGAARPVAPRRSRGPAEVSRSGSSRAGSRRRGSRACRGSPAAAWWSPPFRWLAGVRTVRGAPPGGRAGGHVGAARVGLALQQPDQVRLQGLEAVQLGADLREALAQ
jgi:hypothetical protein